MKLQQHFSVPFSYAVHFTRHLFSHNQALLAQVLSAQPGFRPKVALLVEETLWQAHPTFRTEVESWLTTPHTDFQIVTPQAWVLPGGEACKNDWEGLLPLIKNLSDAGMDRHSYILAVGGGAFLDRIGFAAAITHRGIRLVRIPSTVLGQNDSGVGVKNSLNLFGKKNFVGTFAPPYAVINDSSLLDTLDERNWRAGMAEAIKVALLKDADFFAWLQQNAQALLSRQAGAMDHLIYHCARLHLEHIASGDPFELGSSRPLDFGHWSAHKLEQLSAHRVLHGEAVALGLALDLTYSRKKGWLAESHWQAALGLMEELGFSLWEPELAEHDEQGRLLLLAGLDEFREHLGGQLTLMMLQAPGQGLEVHDMDESLLEECLAELAQR